eukprot:TRINITY_DN30079_c0_g1_i2.p1 TRINITY_DN30079_c0_g1~~TRINITY_DN30079_c0_g1_i2.p1  ORF type:complete len:446 (+),score=81.06 TRINITY_DN30079_c0_g1_i2:117-1454(+)
MTSRGGLWGWLDVVGGSCGFGGQQKQRQWVKAIPELVPQEVPGMDEAMLSKISQVGGSLEEKLQTVIDHFRGSARHLESLQTLLRKKACLDRAAAGFDDELPTEVQAVISEGTYGEGFLKAYDAQTFLLYREEIVPGHEYRLALEVHTGGAYWSGIAAQDAATVVHKVETVSASSQVEGSASILSQFGAAQRGAVFVWRWHHMPEKGPYALPRWLEQALVAEGNDPLRKLEVQIEAIRRWEQQLRNETAQHLKKGKEIKDPYIREVLRLWPTEVDGQKFDQPKKCAWIEGLDSKLFVGRAVVVHQAPYDESHTLLLKALIAKRHVEADAPPEGNPPYKLTTTWQWLAPAPASDGVQVPALPQSAALPGSSSRAGLPSRSEALPDSGGGYYAAPATPQTSGGYIPTESSLKENVAPMTAETPAIQPSPAESQIDPQGGVGLAKGGG